MGKRGRGRGRGGGMGKRLGEMEREGERITEKRERMVGLKLVGKKIE